MDRSALGLSTLARHGSSLLGPGSHTVFTVPARLYFLVLPCMCLTVFQLARVLLGPPELGRPTRTTVFPSLFLIYQPSFLNDTVQHPRPW